MFTWHPSGKEGQFAARQEWEPVLARALPNYPGLRARDVSLLFSYDPNYHCCIETLLLLCDGKTSDLFWSYSNAKWACDCRHLTWSSPTPWGLGDGVSCVPGSNKTPASHMASADTMPTGSADALPQAAKDKNSDLNLAFTSRGGSGVMIFFCNVWLQYRGYHLKYPWVAWLPLSRTHD